MSTESPSSSKKSHLHSLHHGHRHHHHHHSHSSRHRAKDAVQSAIPLHPPTSFGDLLRQARVKGSSSTTPSESRRGSVQEAALDGQAEASDEQAGAARRTPRKPLRPADVEGERKKAKAREDDLQTTLQTLSDQSLKVSRRLDDTFYSILEKVSLWRQTIGSLQELASLTKELHENFEADTRGLAEDIKGQFEGFDSFDAQQEQVAALEARIKAGKEKADALNARLAAAQQRVDARAKSEEELEARKIRRARIVWGVLGTIAGLVLLAILVQQLRPVHTDVDAQSHQDFSSRAAILDAPIPDMAKEAIMSAVTSSSWAEARAPRPMTALQEDGRLRIFDEL